jgi:hypothetical protein
MFKGAHFIRDPQGPLPIGQADTLASPPLALPFSFNCKMDYEAHPDEATLTEVPQTLHSPHWARFTSLRRVHTRRLFISSSAIVLFLSSSEVRKQQPLWSRHNAETITSESNRSLSAPAPWRWRHHQLGLVSVDRDLVTCVLSQFGSIIALLKFATWQVL